MKREIPPDFEIWSNEKSIIEIWIWRDKKVAEIHYLDQKGKHVFWPQIRLETAEALAKDMDMQVSRPGMWGTRK